MTGHPCANCGRDWPTRTSRAQHERRGHPGWYPPTELLQERERERWANQSPESKRAARLRYVERHRERIAVRRKVWEQANPEKVALAQARYRLGHREDMRRRSSAYRKTAQGRRRAFLIRQRQIADGKHAARMAVTRALQEGPLERRRCRICGDPNSQAHHHLGYERRFWLVVDWLCVQHHNDAHHPEAAKRRQQLDQVTKDGAGSRVEQIA